METLTSCQRSDVSHLCDTRSQNYTRMHSFGVVTTQVPAYFQKVNRYSFPSNPISQSYFGTAPIFATALCVYLRHQLFPYSSR